MSHAIKIFLKRWLVSTLAVLVAAYSVSGIHYEKPMDLFVASLVLGILNVFVRPLMMFLALPLLIFTLGLFTIVINALLLYAVGYLLKPHFYVDDFWSAFWGALIISLVSLAVNSLVGSGDSRVNVRWRRRPPDSRRDDGDGPVIDV